MTEIHSKPAASECEKRLAALPAKLRDFIKKGMAHGLTYDEMGKIGGAFRFIQFDHVVPDTFGRGEPRPEDLPWVCTRNSLWIAVPADEADEVVQDANCGEAKELEARLLESCVEAVWPENLSEWAAESVEMYDGSRWPHEYRLPNFFAADLYDANRDEPTLISGMLPEHGISIFAGEYDSGKTVLLVDMAAHVAYGIPWLGRGVEWRPVIYYALEAGDDVSKRLLATGNKLKLGEGSPFGTGSVPVCVESAIPATYEQWGKQICRLNSETRSRLHARLLGHGLDWNDYLHVEGFRAPVVFVDTLRQACKHKSRGPEVEEFFDKVDRLVKGGVASHVIIAHHTTKSGEVFAGDDFLASDSTSLYYVRRPNPDRPSFRLICERVKGIGKPPAMTLTFRVVEVGKQSTVVLSGETEADPKLLEIARGLPERIGADGLREALEPHLTGQTEAARYKSYQRLRHKLLDVGLIAQEGGEYVRST